MQNKSILVIDDSREMLDLQKMILENDGFIVTTALGGAVALELLAHMKEPTLIILDQQMDYMSGSEFLDILQGRKPNFTSHVPVVFMSCTQPPPNDKAVGFIQKFPDIDVFLEKVHHFIAHGVAQRLLH